MKPENKISILELTVLLPLLVHSYHLQPPKSPQRSPTS